MTSICCPRCSSLEISLGANLYYCETCNYKWKHNDMARNMKYEWCSNDKSTKELFGWIYERLQNKGDHFNDDHMRRLDEFIDTMPGTIPDGPPITINVTDNKPVTILRHGKLIYKE